MKQLNASYDIAGLFYSYVLLFSLFYLTIGLWLEYYTSVISRKCIRVRVVIMDTNVTIVFILSDRTIR